jgi:protein-disulfide isomerase
MEQQKSFFEGDPKGVFVFGLVTGIALTLLVSNLFGGAFAAGGTNRAANNAPTPVVDAQPTPSQPAPAGELAPVTDEDHVLGDLSEASVIMVEYSDFECPFCERHHPTLKAIVDEFGDDVAWVYRHLPLSFHQQAQPAALASECAAEQGEFWTYSDELFANQARLGDALYEEIAQDLGLNMNQFTDCYESEKYATAIAEDQASAQAAGASGTPATFVNGQLVSGAQPLETFRQIIQAEIANK